MFGIGFAVCNVSFPVCWIDLLVCRTCLLSRHYLGSGELSFFSSKVCWFFSPPAGLFICCDNNCKKYILVTCDLSGVERSGSLPG